MRRTPWFDRCLDWIFEAYTHATAPDDVRDYLARYPELDEVLVKMIVQIRTRVAHDIRIEAKMVDFGSSGEYLEVTARQMPMQPSFVAAIQEIWDEQIDRLYGKSGWIALLADDWTAVRSAPAASPRRAKAEVRKVQGVGRLPVWASAN